jgi:hypothetical protein
MNESTRDTTKPRKQRPGITGEPVMVRVQPDMAKQLDDWRRIQDDLPGRPEAIRRLVEIGLANASPMKPKAAPPANAKRAEELAAKVIDGVMPPGTPTEERKVRRRKILEGPSTIRDVRIDRPKSR